MCAPSSRWELLPRAAAGIDEALAYYRKAVNSDGSDVKAVFGLVQLLEKQGKLDDALAELRSPAGAQ